MLITVTGRMVRSHGVGEVALPESGRITLTPLSHGVWDGALRGRDSVVMRVTDGVAVPVDLTPGPWRVRVEPEHGPAWDSWQVELEPGMAEPVDLADLAPVVVIDGEKWAQGAPGAPGASVTGGRDNGDGTVSFELSDGTYTDPVAVPPGPAGRGISSISDPDADSRVTITFTDGSETTVQAVRGAKGDRGTDSTVPGPPPTVSWSGDRLVVGGVQGPPLTGPQGAGGVPETAFSAGIENKSIDLPLATFVTVPFGAAGVKSNVGGGIWWPNESEWTVPATGVYTIVATVRIADSSTARSVGIGVHTSNVDFSDFIWGNQGGIQRDTRMYSRIARLNAGDRMRLYIRSESGYNLKAASLSIARIS